MRKFQIGEFEEIVLLTVGVLYQEAYGVSIKREIEGRLLRSVSVGALQAALVRLERKGYLQSATGEATQERAGRPKRFYRLTTYGKACLEHTRDKRNALWDAIPKLALDPKFLK